VLGRGVGEERLLQRSPEEGVEVEVAAEPALRGLPDPEPVGLLGVALELVELLGEVGVRDLRGDNLEDRAGESPQRLGVVVTRELDQVCLGLDLELGVEVLRQRVDTGDDRQRLLLVDLGLGHGGGRDRVPIQTGGQPRLPMRLGPARPVATGEQRGHRARTHLPRQSDGLGMSDDPGLELRGLCLQGRDVVERLLRLRCTHRPRPLTRHRPQRRPGTGDRSTQAVGRRCCGVGHASTPPRGADSPRRRRRSPVEKA
jgi:hypothetical protein